MATATAREKRPSCGLAKFVSCGLANFESPWAGPTKEDCSFSVDTEGLTFDEPNCAGLALEEASGGEGGGEGEKG